MRILTIALTIVVLPVPGPPVIIVILLLTKLFFFSYIPPNS